MLARSRPDTSSVRSDNMRKAAVVTKRIRKPAAKGSKTARKASSKSRPGKAAGGRKPAKVAKTIARTSTRKSRPEAKTVVQPTSKSATRKKATPTAKSASRPASVKTAAKAVAAARASASKRRPPSYIPRSRFSDDWMLGGPVELPRQPSPAAHTPTRKPPKPRAPKPKAISHEQAVANLKALLESRKRKDRGADTGASASKSA